MSTTASQQATASRYKKYIESGQYPKPDSGNYESWASAAQWRFRDWLPPGRMARCLDLGTGCGQALYMLKGLGYKDIRGIDISPECVRLAQMMHLPVQQADAIQWLSETTDRFDLILAIDLLEHLADDAVMSLLTQAHQRLTDNGVFIAQTVNGESPMFGQIRYGDFTHLNAFTKESLSALLTQAGFAESRFRPVGPYPHGLTSFARAAAWKLIVNMLNMWNLIETGRSGSGIFTRNLIFIARKK